jgi:eukaryotic-like serine/threonine-protein kinase
MPEPRIGISRMCLMQWRKGDKIGYGRFGLVYDAYRADATDDAEAVHAVKYLQRDLVASEQIVKRFRREVKILQSLNHENVMPVIDSGISSKGIPWFVMPKARDGSLKDAIARGATNDLDWVVAVFRGVLEGVAHAHERKILHRDLKPSNILLFGITPKISDLGIAKQLDLDGTTLTQSAQELGTLRYMSPEQLANSKRAGPAADVYSLGKIFAHMLTGTLPEPFKVDVSAVPSEFRFFVDKCCRTEPTERYPDARSALDGFDRFVRDEAIIAPPPERLRELAKRALEEASDDDQVALLEEIDVHVRANPDDDEMFHDVWIRLAKDTVWAMATRLPDGFREQLRLYDEHVSGSLRFDYCDVVADRYSFIYKVSDDIEVHRTVLNRLIDLGYSHNRWHVREVLIDMLSSAKSRVDVALAEEAIIENPRQAAWIADEALRRPLRQPIADALKHVSQQTQAAGF